MSVRSKWFRRLLLVIFLAVGVGLVAKGSFARVTAAGAWPEKEKPVSVRLSGTRTEAIEKLADVAGWSVVLPTSLNDDAERLDVVVKDQSPLDALEAILHPGDFVATRKGQMVTVRKADATADATGTGATGTTNAKERGTREGEDRTVMGGNLTIGKDDVVADVAVVGGSVDVYGTITGDIAVTGGSVKVHDGAHIRGDATAIGGALELERGARVDGDVGVVGGHLKRHPGSIIRGKVTGGEGAPRDGTSASTEKQGADHDVAPAAEPSFFARVQDKIGGSLRRATLLYVFGVVMLAIASRRMESLGIEVAARPMRSVVLGIVAGIGGIGLLILLCVTIIGIPLAALLALGAVVAVYAGIVAVLTTMGAGLLRHRTRNPYVHLAAGCALFFLIGALPWVGGLLTTVVTLMAIGVCASTRVGGKARRVTA